MSLRVRLAGTRLTAAFKTSWLFSAHGPGAASGYPLGVGGEGKESIARPPSLCVGPLLGADPGARTCGQRVRWLELGCLGPDGKRQQVTNGMAPSAGTGDLSQGRAAPAARDRTFLDLPDATFWDGDLARLDLWPTRGFPAGAFLCGPGPAGRSWPDAGLRDAAPGRERSAAN